MIFRIAEENKQRAAHAFIVERLAHDYGYKKSAMLYPKSNHIMHYYEIDMLDADRIICTVRHKNTDCIVALVWLSGYTPESIEVDQAELYRNCSNYPYRREYNSKYLKKYDQIACVVHGAIINGLLFDAESDKEPEAVQDTTCTENEPQRATETAQKTAGDTTPAADQEKPENAHRRTEPAEAVQDTTLNQTEPPRATDAATTGNGEQTTTAAATTPSGDRSTANKMTGSHAGPAKEMTAERSERRKRYLQRMIGELARKRRKARRDAKEMTTGRTTPPRHACENAPGRTERAQAEQVHTHTNKSPPRAAQKAGRNTSRGSPDRRKGTFFGLLVILDPVTSEF